MRCPPASNSKLHASGTMSDLSTSSDRLSAALKTDVPSPMGDNVTCMSPHVPLVSSDASAWKPPVPPKPPDGDAGSCSATTPASPAEPARESNDMSHGSGYSSVFARDPPALVSRRNPGNDDIFYYDSSDDDMDDSVTGDSEFFDSGRDGEDLSNSGRDGDSLNSGRDNDDVSVSSTDSWHDITGELNAVNIDIAPPTNFPDVKTSRVVTSADFTKDRANLDTGTWCTCTDKFYLIHGYRRFTKAHPCPITLKPATTGSDAVPQGWGYLHVPARNRSGFLAVRVFYTPKLRTTVIDERDFIRAAGHHPNDIASETIHKHYDAGTFTYHAVHKKKRTYDVVVHGILRNGKMYTGELIPAFSKARAHEFALQDESFVADCKKATLLAIYAHQEAAYSQLRNEMKHLPPEFHTLPFHEYIQNHTPVNAISKEVEQLLWHQRLGHPSDSYLFNAHKHIKGVPRFTTVTSVLDTCPTCIRAGGGRTKSQQNLDG